MLAGIITGKRGMTIQSWSKVHGLEKSFARALYRSLEDPDEMPYVLDAITKGFGKLPKPAKKEVRNALIRVQIQCSIHGNSDPLMISKQLYIAQTLEKLLFGSNLLLDGVEEEPERKKS